MSSRRALKVAEAIREVVSTAILIELKDPRVQGVTVTHVEASGDLRYAKVHVSVMGDETAQQLTLRGLQHAAGYLQSKVGDRLEMRYTPRLTFVLDQGVKKSIEVARILREVLPPPEGPLDDEADEATAHDPEAPESPAPNPSQQAPSPSGEQGSPADKHSAEDRPSA